MPETLKTPKDKILTAPVRVEGIVNVYQDHQILGVHTPWGVFYVRDDAEPFKTLREAQDRTSVVPEKPAEPEKAPE